MSISHISVGTTREKFPEMIKFYDALMKELGAKRQMVVAVKPKIDKDEGGDDGQDEKNGEANRLDPNSEYNDTVVAVAYGKYYPQYWVQLPHNDNDDLNKAENEASPGNGVHIAFDCRSQKQVQDEYNVAIANGGTCNGKPGPRIEYSDKYYGAFFIDPFGNKLEATFFDLGFIMNTFCTIL